MGGIILARGGMRATRSRLKTPLFFSFFWFFFFAFCGRDCALRSVCGLRGRTKLSRRGGRGAEKAGGPASAGAIPHEGAGERPGLFRGGPRRGRKPKTAPGASPARAQDGPDAADPTAPPTGPRRRKQHGPTRTPPQRPRRCPARPPNNTKRKKKAKKKKKKSETLAHIPRNC